MNNKALLLWGITQRQEQAMRRNQWDKYALLVQFYWQVRES